VAPPERRSDPELVEDAEERLAELADRLHGMGVETRTMVREGEAVGEILAAEAEVDPTTILMGARGKSRLRRLLLGSTSEDVTARANSNVLLVPPTGLR
jgi:nucleotide-binding universal stress UspA family protein